MSRNKHWSGWVWYWGMPFEFEWKFGPENYFEWTDFKYPDGYCAVRIVRRGS